MECWRASVGCTGRLDGWWVGARAAVVWCICGTRKSSGRSSMNPLATHWNGSTYSRNTKKQVIQGVDVMCCIFSVSSPYCVVRIIIYALWCTVAVDCTRGNPTITKPRQPRPIRTAALGAGLGTNTHIFYALCVRSVYEKNSATGLCHAIFVHGKCACANAAHWLCIKSTVCRCWWPWY